MVENPRAVPFREQSPKPDIASSLHVERELMRITDPHILEGRILAHACRSFSPQVAEHVQTAVTIVKDLYEGKERKFSHTASILHPFRVTLGGDNSKPHMTIIKLLHDTMEDYDLSERSMTTHFGEMGPLVTQGVSALTRRKGESYRDYLARIKHTAETEPDLAELMDDKAADMINNCLDPFGLPATVKRKPHTAVGMKKFLDKIDEHAVDFFENRQDLFERVTEAVALGRQALEHPDLILT